MPAGYRESRSGNGVDLLVSAVFAAHFVTVPSPGFLSEILDGGCPGASPALVDELRHKQRAGCLSAISPAPDPSCDPSADRALYRRYGPEDHAVAKPFNKLRLQEQTGLTLDSKAPLFFWPGRLDDCRAEGELVLESMPILLQRYEREGLQLVFIGDGDVPQKLRQAAAGRPYENRTAACPFDPGLHRLAFGAADFLLVLRQPEPSGLNCRIGRRYGVLPVAYACGGTRDAVDPLDVEKATGNGFLFRHFDLGGILWAVEQAMGFRALPPAIRECQVERIMLESRDREHPHEAARRYLELYDRMLDRPMAAGNRQVRPFRRRAGRGRRPSPHPAGANRFAADPSGAASDGTTG